LLDLLLKPVEPSTLALGGAALVRTKGFGWATLSLLKFSF
jgi:hypothetical protein